MNVISDEQQIKNHFKRLSEVREQQWLGVLKQMSSTNVDLTLISKAAYSISFKLDNKRFQLDIHTHRHVVDAVTGNDETVDAIYQLWHKSKSIIVGVPLHPMCDRRWNDDVVSLSDWAKVLSSMMLNTEEGRGSYFVIRDILYRIAAVDPSVRDSGIFAVLD